MSQQLFKVDVGRKIWAGSHGCKMICFLLICVIDRNCAQWSFETRGYAVKDSG